jgi:hypothetical protein
MPLCQWALGNASTGCQHNPLFTPVLRIEKVLKKLFLKLLDDFFWGLKASTVTWMSCNEANCNFKFFPSFIFWFN